MRFYLTGRVTVEGPQGVVDEGDLPGLQGRVLLVVLALERRHPMSTEELGSRLWSDDRPGSWEGALRALVSKLRGSLAVAGMDPDLLAGSSGTYQLRVPGAFVDVEAAVNALDRAEGARRRGALDEAWGHATVASSIASRPLLPGEEAAWIEAEREGLRQVELRALDCLAEVWSGRGEHDLAVNSVRRALELAPYREATYRRLMRIHLAAGDRAEAVAAFGRCRAVLEEELGVGPSPETEAVYLAALRAG
ncbi:MAG: BTAD domain-containing putative transcriptional regulator [Nitriliruptorales bacterium]|nr:BTAD domain-containing putative transcriptional regulator [Nitriliruptorales bacterium]